MNDERFEADPELTRLLRAVRADRDPALWTRVRARIEARQHQPWLLRWAMRPAALGASLALFVAVTALAVTLGTGGTVTGGDTYTSIADALVDERDSEVRGESATPAPAVTPMSTPGAASDTGASR
jgi:hypothetical protein